MTSHIDDDLLARYAGISESLPDAAVWVVEVHLETCSGCRSRLGAVVPPETAMIVARIGSELTGALPAVVPHRRLGVVRRWSTWSLLPRLMVSVGALLAALLLEVVNPHYPSPVLLIAPVVPLFGVAAACSRRDDPAWELVAASPQGGVLMVLRRTVTVLAALLPVLALVGWAAGTSVALWLLPCLTVTSATLALGSLLGVRRAAGVVTAAWVAVVTAPAMLTHQLPAVLNAGTAPVWAATGLALAALVWSRADAFQRLASRN
ncbi:cupin domain-containing protein [Actinoplanes awajinensis]|uniref:Zinc-finger domain-containing protein n=1 Tax=Actinoplanes awajinensis subsp. mycoplanecinus TaxID=135947 RepID=A0A117MRG9_9ACTN|nr:hypothetical protein [Actinoplanes awajinensis]KUL31735.1 hypothetical protein ADL15_21400 [Actinoplanes awajinensis subsp. mycoplanecinus]